MIHPSTMAGPNWLTGSFGTTNPFQQNTSPFFRNASFQNQQGGFGPGNNPFQGQPFGFGTNTMQMQNTIHEIVRQAIPTILTNYGFQPSNGFQTQFGFQTPGSQQGTFGFQTPFGFQNPTGPTPFGTQFRNLTPHNIPGFGDWQNQNFLSELIRQATNQSLQNLAQQNPNLFNPGTFGQNQPFFGLGNLPFTGTQNPSDPFSQQRDLWNFVGQVSTQACVQITHQVCQAIITCASACLSQQNSTSNLFNPAQQQQQQQQQRDLWNFIGQICTQACVQICNQTCQAITSCVSACLTQQNQTQGNLFNTQTTPFNFNTTSTFGPTSGIPTGAGAF